MTNPKRAGFLCVAVGTTLLSFGASANVMIYSGLEGGSGVQSVLYDGLQLGWNVNGITSQTKDRVEFSSSDLLYMLGSGQASVRPIDGSLRDLTIGLADDALGFSTIQFNIDAEANGSATLSFWDQFGNLFSNTFSLSRNGQNLFTAIATDVLMVRARIQSSVGIDEVGAVSLGPASLTAPPPRVDEPGTVSLLLIGLALLAGAARYLRGRPTLLPATA